MTRALLLALTLTASLTACVPVTPGPVPSTAATGTEAPPTTSTEPSVTVIPGPTTTTVVPTPTVTAQPPTTVVVPPPVTVTPTPTTTTVVPPPPPGRTYPWHNNIVSTTFWVGEIFDPALPDGSQVCSTYDSKWALHWSGIQTGTVPANADGCPGSPKGGCDGAPGANKCATEARHVENGYFPVHSSVVPRENPFYLDLPFDDVNDTTGFKTRCTTIPWANDVGYKGKCADENFSYMKNRWVRIVGPNGTTCYGQIEDAGPSSGSAYHDSVYVFGSNDARPAHKDFNNAGLDVSPALNGCLGFAQLDGENDHVKWQFVDSPPAGPWTKVVTASGFTP